ncbi:photosystem II cytochrome b559 subunit alpha [Vigna unguiculata]|uniref:Photosystem II cytochrome b559 subunit alpha n=1 Tax=Vigna unguiculata TaxID=3917 RepID=A0A4D6N9S8_VIGUN|nr:photosystem II cytochrome b559 subunit alpha [Vigna unguiculata]
MDGLNIQCQFKLWMGGNPVTQIQVTNSPFLPQNSGVTERITILFKILGGWLFVSTGLAYDVFGSPRPNEYFTENRQGIPLITGRFDPLEQLDEFSRSF